MVTSAPRTHMAPIAPTPEQVPGDSQHIEGVRARAGEALRFALSYVDTGCAGAGEDCGPDEHGNDLRTRYWCNGRDDRRDDRRTQGNVRETFGNAVPETAAVGVELTFQIWHVGDAADLVGDGSIRVTIVRIPLRERGLDAVQVRGAPPAILAGEPLNSRVRPINQSPKTSI